MNAIDLRTWRKRCGITQAAMATAIGLSLRAYHDIETADGATVIRPTIFAALERVSLTLALQQGRPDILLPGIREQVAGLRWDAHGDSLNGLTSA